MAFRLNVKNGKIHSTQSLCHWGRNLKEGDYIDYNTFGEAKAKAKEDKNLPCLCKRCRFREDLQREMDI